jgi:Ca-activated chloride channel family protein
VTRPGNDAFLSEGQAAIDKLQAELAAAPDSRKRHEALVRGLLLRGRFAQALTSAERFVELDPDLAAAREVLAYAAAATGDSRRAVETLDTLTENDPNSSKAHGRVARAFEALGDETRACAHWRSVAELLPGSDSALYESLRCRARALADGQNALAEARAVARPGPLLQRLIPLLSSDKSPAYEKATSNAGQFEVQLTCEPKASCPYLIVVTPTGTVMSPWTPGLSRSSSQSFAFSGLLTGSYRVLRVGGASGATGKVDVRALNARNVFDLVTGQSQTVAVSQVTLAPSGLGLLGIGRF